MTTPTREGLGPVFTGPTPTVHAVLPGAGLAFSPERMLDLGRIDVEEIATALADQTNYEHRWLIDPRTGQVAFWTSDTGIDGENPVEIDELDLILIEPLPSHIWYQDMADFADGISDTEAARQLSASLQGRGAATETPSLRAAYTRGATLATSAKQVEEGDRLTLTATIASPAQAARVTLQKSYVSVYYGTASWEPVKTVAVRGRRAVKFGVVAVGPNADRFRVSVTYKTGKPAASRPTNVQVWRRIPLSKYTPYYATSGAIFGDLALNGHPYKGWGAATYSNARAWEAKFTPGRHCKTFRGVIGVADISADGSSGAINFTADDEIVYESPSLTPGMDVPVTIRLSTPYRFGIQAFNTSPEGVRSWPVIGDPALLCTAV